MIGLLTFDNTQAEQFKDHDIFYDHFSTNKSSNSSTKSLDLENGYWNFTIYSPRRVAALYMYSKGSSIPIREAYEENLPLIEICTGNYENPLHIVLRPHIVLNDLRDQWCRAYYACHHFNFGEVDYEDDENNSRGNYTC